jgi:plasmid stabilization system protein ParE
MDYKVVLAPRAIDDLRDIVSYVASDRPEAAARLGYALVEKTKLLSVFPFSGRVVPEFGDATIRELVLPPFRIVYRLDEGRRIAGVARFWHGARGDLMPGDIAPSLT